MKKCIITTCTLFVCMVAMAGNPLNYVLGKSEMKDILKQTATVEIVFDWSNTLYDSRTPIAEQFADDTEFIITDCEAKFISGFNDKAKSLTMQRGETDATYRFILEVRAVDSFYAAMRVISRFEAKMWGTLKVVSVATGETVVEIDIDEAEDGCDFAFKKCFGETFRKLGERLAKQ